MLWIDILPWFLLLGIVLISVVGIFFGRRLMKNEERRSTGIVILAVSVFVLVAIGLYLGIGFIYVWFSSQG